MCQTKAFDEGYRQGVTSATDDHPAMIYGLPPIPVCRFRSTGQRNAFGSGFHHGFRSVANLRLPTAA